MIKVRELNNYKKKILNWDLIEYNSIDSTNEQIKRLYCPPYERNLIVVSNEQTCGKGRYGRKWVSPYSCGFYGSWLLYYVIQYAQALQCKRITLETTQEGVNFYLN